MTLADTLRDLLGRAACDQQVPGEARKALAFVAELEMIAELFLEGHGHCLQRGCLCAGASEALARIAALGAGEPGR